MKILKIFYKSMAVILLFYTLFSGLTVKIPELPVIGDSIRNIFFHVGMWFSMIALLCISLICSISFLKTQKKHLDLIAGQAVNLALLFGLLGILTGMVWAKVTWTTWWVNDPKLNGAAITMLCYLAYKVLRSSVKDPLQQSRVAAVYNILAFAMMMVFMMILPRTGTGSIHPGPNGNPALNPGELDNNMRIVFYPAITGWILFSIWLLELSVRLKKLSYKFQ